MWVSWYPCPGLITGSTSAWEPRGHHWPVGLCPPGLHGANLSLHKPNDNDKDDGNDDGALEAQDAGGCAEGSGWQEKE